MQSPAKETKHTHKTNWSCSAVQLRPKLLSSNAQSQVEICAGEGALTKALQGCGMNAKAFDVAGLHKAKETQR